MARVDLSLPQLLARLEIDPRFESAADPIGVAASYEHQQRGGVALYLARDGRWTCARWSEVGSTRLPMRATIHDAAKHLTDEERDVLGLAAEEARDDAMVEAAADAEARSTQLSR